MSIDRDRVLRSAAKYVTRKRYNQAIEAYLSVLEHEPRDARLLLKVGDLYTRKGAYPRAIDTYARAGRIYADDGFAAKAVAVYKQVQQLLDEEAPHLTDYYVYVYPTLASLYQELRLSAEALGMYDAYAAVLSKNGRIREAATVLSVVVNRGGDNPLTRLRLADLWLEQGNKACAIHQFLSAADALVERKRPDEAVKVLDHALERTDAPELARKSARLLLDKGSMQDGMQALVRLQKAFRLDPKHLGTLELLAAAFDTINQSDRSFEVRKETIRIAKEQGQLEIARASLAALLEVAPNDPDLHALAISIAPIKGTSWPVPTVDLHSRANVPPMPSAESSPADELHAASINLKAPIIEEVDVEGSDENQAAKVESWVARVQEFVQQGDVQRAIVSLEFGVESAPHHKGLRLMLKDLLVESGEINRAIEELLVVAEQCFSAGDKADAMACLNEILKLDPEHNGATSMLAAFGSAESISLNEQLESDLQPISLLPIPTPPETAAPIPADSLQEGVLSHKPLADIRGFRGRGDASDALEEAEFFASRNLFEDALAIVKEQLELMPHDPALLQKLEDLQVQAAGAQSGAHPTVLGVMTPTPQADRVAKGADPEFLDIALAGLPPAETATRVDLEGGTLDVDDLFDAFKAGIAEQVGDGDSQMHYDLGLAYLEMGRYDSAIDAFGKAARDSSRACVSFSMMASVHQRQGDLDKALEALERAAGVERKTREEEVGVHYELASLFEARGNVEQAVANFQKVVHLAPDFRDARQRLRALQGRSSPLSAPTHDDEFERAFRELFVDEEKE